MKKLLWVGLILLTACQTNKPKTIEWAAGILASGGPGSVVAQSINKDLGNGFYKVSKSIVNPPGHWEGIGHFGFIYFGKTEICQCSDYDTVLSPDGKYFVYYSVENRRLELFNTHSKTVSVLSDEYVGRPKSANWNLETSTAIIYLVEPSTEEKLEELEIKLD